MARAVLRIAAARALLSQHHSAQNMPKNGRKYAKFEGELGWRTQGSRRTQLRGKAAPQTPTGKQAQGGGAAFRGGKGGGGAAFVIPGAKREPTWKCGKCRFAGNWRCWTACWQCGGAAAERHVMQVMAEVVGAQSNGGGAPTGAAAGGSRTGGAQARGGDPAGVQDRDAARRELQEGQRALDAAKRWGFSDAAVAAMQAELDAKRARFQAAKPRAALLKLAERKASELAEKLAGHKRKEDALREAVADALDRLNQHQVAEASLVEKLAAAKAEVDQQRLRALVEGEGCAGEALDPLASLPAAWRAVLARREDQKAELLEEYRNFVAEQQAEADAEDPSEDGGSSDGMSEGRPDGGGPSPDLLDLYKQALADAGIVATPQAWEAVRQVIADDRRAPVRTMAEAAAAAATPEVAGPGAGKRAKLGTKDGDGDAVM